MLHLCFYFSFVFHFTSMSVVVEIHVVVPSLLGLLLVMVDTPRLHVWWYFIGRTLTRKICGMHFREIVVVAV